MSSRADQYFLRRGISQLAARFKNRSDSEHEQAAIRLVLGFLTCCYLLILDFSDSEVAKSIGIVWIVVCFLTASVLLFAAIVLRPNASPVRRHLGIIVDLTATSAAMGVAGEAAAPMLAIYLWVILGNGFRYGVKYLAAATVAGLIGFFCVYLWSDFWHLHKTFSVSFFIVLIVLPTYVSTLIKKLTEAIRRANDANEEKSRFLAKMSHELRTPLNGVIGMSDLLLDSNLPARQYGFAKTIQSSARTLLGIIENILDFSKIEAGRITIESVAFDLHELVNDTIHMFKPQVERKGLALSVHVDPSVPFSLHGDPLHLRQILTNLLDNAVKFTDKGKVELRITSIGNPMDENSIRVRFEIEDTGIGIPAPDQARIFESFQQAANSTTRLYGGTGLGTAISRELARLMGGDISLQSHYGKGTVFCVELPFKLHLAAHQEQTIGLRHTRILLLGDGSEAGNDIAESLRNWKIEHVMVRSCARAYEELLKARDGAPYSLVFVVASAIEMDPAQFAQGMRKDRLLSTVELVLIHLEQDRHPDRYWHNAGYSTVLHAPIATNLLFNTIHAATSLHKSVGNVVSLSDYYCMIASRKECALHVLVAEDNETNRSVLKEVLVRIGLSVTVVADGEAALDAIEEHHDHFDLIILDKNMPRRSGLDAFRAYCFMYPNHRAPCIMLTADATRNGINECMEAGVDAYLTKPVDTSTLLETIARLGAREEKTDIAEESKHHGPAAPVLGLDRRSGIIDLEKIESLRSLGTDASFFSNLINGFLADSRRSVDNIAVALEGKDFPAFRDALHALKGSAEELGAVMVAAVCDQLRKLKPYELGSADAARLLERLRQINEQTGHLLKDLR